MKQFVGLFLAASVIVHLLFVLMFPGKDTLSAFAFGWAVFAVNLAILGWLGSRMLGRGERGKENAQKAKGSLRFVFLSFLKLPLLAGALYLGLVVFGFSPWFLVAGAAGGLLVTTALFYWQYLGGTRLAS